MQLAFESHLLVDPDTHSSMSVRMQKGKVCENEAKSGNTWTMNLL